MVWSCEKLENRMANRVYKNSTVGSGGRGVTVEKSRGPSVMAYPSIRSPLVEQGVTDKELQWTMTQCYITCVTTFRSHSTFGDTLALTCKIINQPNSTMAVRSINQSPLQTAHHVKANNNQLTVI